MILLGIDPGTATTGWGVIAARDEITYSNGHTIQDNVSLINYGCIITEQVDRMEVRLKILKEQLDAVLEKYNPDVVVVERLFFGVNAKTGISVAQARGVIMLATAEKNAVYEEYTGLQIKKGMTGSGKADKKEMQNAVLALFNLTHERFDAKVMDQNGKKIFRFRDDAADALACALFHFKKQHGLLEDGPHS
jgi:crossover junction endodeoxyribonuclease RuvC